MEAKIYKTCRSRLEERITVQRVIGTARYHDSYSKLTVYHAKFEIESIEGQEECMHAKIKQQRFLNRNFPFKPQLSIRFNSKMTTMKQISISQRDSCAVYQLKERMDELIANVSKLKSRASSDLSSPLTNNSC